MAPLVSEFAAAVVRSGGRWCAAELSLDDASDLEDVTDRLRDVDPEADVALLFVEAEETYLAILRLDDGEDPRVFSSDAAFADETRTGGLLLSEDRRTAVEIDAELTAPAAPDAEPPRGAMDPGNPAIVEPAGDPTLLADLGVPATQLLELCARSEMLPSDITAEVCMAIGAGDDVEEIRQA
jgi:putative tRNA adenosine deaminase-associated protein